MFFDRNPRAWRYLVYLMRKEYTNKPTCAMHEIVPRSRVYPAPAHEQPCVRMRFRVSELPLQQGEHIVRARLRSYPCPEKL